VRVEPRAPNYGRRARTPLPQGAAALSAIVALLAGIAWGADDAVRVDGSARLDDLNDAWASVSQVLLPHEAPSTLVTAPRALVVLGLAVVVLVTTTAWVGRIGRNVAVGREPFGAGLALLGLPAWWILPLTLGTTGAARVPSRTDLLLRFALALLIFVPQFLLARWVLHNRVWRAGRLRADYAAIALWAVELVPWALYLFSSLYEQVARREGSTEDLPWEPTQTMLEWGWATSRASLVAIGALLVVVSVRQHLGIASDRRAEAEEHAPPPAPGTLTGPAGS
jgi:hypothetical protein